MGHFRNPKLNVYITSLCITYKDDYISAPKAIRLKVLTHNFLLPSRKNTKKTPRQFGNPAFLNS